MTRTDPRKRVDALLPLVSGKSRRAVAEDVGVHPGTIGSWLKDPVFAGELERVREAASREPLDVEAVMAAVDEASARLCGGGPVTVTIPSTASPRRRRQLLARGIARALEAGE
ncbi:hypothetical protein ACFY3G_43285 [Streptomyces phaeochromogenes]|uniref:hypothetical protein n=1 Tax=Streptomyces phaeochromogenes TaxID=1923 RepID=UPI00368941A1